MHIQSTVSAEVHAKFVVWCKSQNRSVRGMLRQMVEDAVVKVELPKEQAPPGKAAVARALTEEERIDQVYLQSFGVPRPKPEEEVFVFDPDDRYWERREGGLTRAQAIAAVRFAIEANAYTREWTPPEDDESEVKPS
jgi:hypothetical protein